MSKKIENVGLLDLTSATEESISEIERIENVGALLLSRNTAKLAGRIRIGNLGVSDVVPDNCKVMQGRVEMNHSYFVNLKEPLSLFINGQVIIKQDVTAEDIENGLLFLEINGQIICPKKISGSVQSKCSKINGKLLTYDDNYYVSTGKINIDDSFLKSLDDLSSLVIIGKVMVNSSLDESLFNQKIKNMEILGSILIKEEYLDIFNKKLENRDGCKVEVIPAGYAYIDEDLQLNKMSIKRLNNVRLYVSGMLKLDDDITADMLEGRIEKLKIKDAILCRSELTEPVFDRCDDYTVSICDYSGRVYVIDGEHTLTESELKYSPEKTTYVVQGSLKVGDDVAPESIFEKVEYIYNFGEITCSPEIYGVLQLKARKSTGEINQNTGKDEDSNIGYLKL